MLRSLLVLILILIVIPAGARAQELTDSERSALFQRMEKSRGERPAAHARFHEEKTTQLLRQPLINEGSIAFESPDKFRREITGANPSITISDGSTLWIYYPNFREAEKYPLGQRAFFDDSIAALTAGMNFDRIEEFYRVNVFREGDGHRFVLAPRKANLRRIMKQLTMWLDAHLLLVKTELLLPNGDRSVTTYADMRREPVPAETFQFTPPAGVKISTPLGKEGRQ